MRLDLINTTDVAYAPLFLVTIDDTTQKFRIVNNNEDVVSRGDTFTAYPFNIILSSDDDKTPEIKVVFDNVHQDLIKLLRETHTPIKVKLEMIWSDDVDSVEKTIEHLSLVGITYNSTTIEATLSVVDVLNLKFPGVIYSPHTYPGLF